MGTGKHQTLQNFLPIHFVKDESEVAVTKYEVRQQKGNFKIITNEPFANLTFSESLSELMEVRDNRCLASIDNLFIPSF